MQWQLICVSLQQCLADTGIDSAAALEAWRSCSVAALLTRLALPQHYLSLVPPRQDLTPSAIPLQFPFLLLDAAWTRYRLAAAGNWCSMNSAAYSNLDLKQPELDADGTRRLGAATLLPSQPPSLPSSLPPCLRPP